MNFWHIDRDTRWLSSLSNKKTVGHRWCEEGCRIILRDVWVPKYNWNKTFVALLHGFYSLPTWPSCLDPYAGWARIPLKEPNLPKKGKDMERYPQNMRWLSQNGTEVGCGHIDDASSGDGCWWCISQAFHFKPHDPTRFQRIRYDMIRHDTTTRILRSKHNPTVVGHWNSILTVESGISRSQLPLWQLTTSPSLCRWLRSNRCLPASRSWVMLFRRAPSRLTPFANPVGYSA